MSDAHAASALAASAPAPYTTEMPFFDDLLPQIGDFKDFVKGSFPVLYPDQELWEGPFLDCLCAHLGAVALGEIKNLLINTPPGVGNSTIVSVLFPVWLALRCPSWELLTFSHHVVPTVRDMERSKQLLSNPMLRGDMLTPPSFLESMPAYNNPDVGARFVSCVGWPPPKRCFDGIIVDTPQGVLRIEDAAYREQSFEWIRFVLRNAMRENGFRIVLQSRLHGDDAAGHLLKEGGWEHLNLPLVYDPAHRYSTSISSEWRSDWRNKSADVLLCPHLYRPEDIEELERKIGHSFFETHYQQNPTDKRYTLSTQEAKLETHQEPPANTMNNQPLKDNPAKDSEPLETDTLQETDSQPEALISKKLASNLEVTYDEATCDENGVPHYYEISYTDNELDRVCRENELLLGVKSGDIFQFKTGLTEEKLPAPRRYVVGVLAFQDGPVLEEGRNGVTEESLIALVKSRLEAFQDGPYACRENALALTKLEEALHWMNARTKNRQSRGVEGTSQV